jgi:spore coat protein U-like protein
LPNFSLFNNAISKE